MHEELENLHIFEDLQKQVETSQTISQDIAQNNIVQVDFGNDEKEVGD